MILKIPSNLVFYDLCPLVAPAQPSASPEAQRYVCTIAVTQLTPRLYFFT